jgi:ABC-type ATPase involved in cell division
MIQVSELDFSTEDALKVLEDVHLRVNRDELVFLVGPPVSGKSLLLGLLAGHIPPQQGQILVLGRNIARLRGKKISELRRKIGFLPQHFVPLAKTVQENILFKLRALGDFYEKAEEKGLTAVDAVTLTKQLHTPAEQLSPLERVKLGIALSLCDEPSLLLYDEPGMDLTQEERRDVFRLLEEIHQQGYTMLVATRGPVLTEENYRIVHFADGKVSEE